MKKLLFIYNARSGKTEVRKYLADIIDTFIKAGYYVDAYQTQKRADATRQVVERGGDFDLIVCCGGDGTLNETITGIMQLEKKVPLGYIPAGSTNDFASTLKMPKDMLKAAQIAVKGEETAVDIGRFNDKNFVYVCCFGAFADVSYQTPQEMKNILGHQAYLLEAMTRILSLQVYNIRCKFDGCEIEGDFLYGMISNSSSVGGIKGITGRDISLCDGLFEVTLVKPPKSPIDLQAIAFDLLNGENKSDFVIRFKTKKLEVESDKKIEWVLDGECGGKMKHIIAENIESAITIKAHKKSV
ncbi:MAG: diacylglycerol kinase family lipid kinase [Lachnospiraceae bacterium]|nr:diacylglycerol kinase family lipid kinase [Lachnospiraceae bacterium]